MRYQEENNYPKAFAWSTGLMALFILISYLIVFGMQAPPEEQGMGGILVNYGTAPEGMGDDFTSIEEPSVAPNANNVSPDKVLENPQQTSDPTSETSDKTVVTQNTEDAPAVTTSKKNTTASPSTSPVTKDSKPAINENALYKGKKNNGTGQGDGTGSTPGNQGDPDGSTLAPNYGEGGSGFGNARLANRTSVIKPKVEDSGQATGRIVIDIIVGKDGEVKSARIGRGTTIADYKLQQKCREAVLGARFNRSETAPESQPGSFVFSFKVD
ncbi:energy transducer TonB [Paradesertivirga mongoliensis]|uniref:Energy transducer TonB n=1 Tax=Paradesertivirga mongoliensis TaxID=2100740 RepID=A0ABW4ZLU1_9SPHI|nr:energy transducer TonB [Pedobacter mongoliensis]